MNWDAEYNYSKFCTRMREIEDALKGINIPAKKLFCDENGNISEEKIEEFTSDVVGRQCNLFGKFIGISVCM